MDLCFELIHFENENQPIGRVRKIAAEIEQVDYLHR